MPGVDKKAALENVLQHHKKDLTEGDKSDVYRGLCIARTMIELVSYIASSPWPRSRPY
jgi:hypothetical protein